MTRTPLVRKVWPRKAAKLGPEQRRQITNARMQPAERVNDSSFLNPGHSAGMGVRFTHGARAGPICGVRTGLAIP
jgi:hypothetical protein